MSRKLLTFGYDACHRWAVLRLAGFTVHACQSIGELRDQLITSRDLDAVLMVEDIVSIPPEAIVAAKSYFDGPLVLFETRPQPQQTSAFDLAIPALTAPNEWLALIESTIQKTHSHSLSQHSDQRS
jgi:hypothetical protein